MRQIAAVCGLLLVACTGPHTTGGLWAEQNLEQEAAIFRTSEEQRAQQAHALEVALADETLALEQARVRGELEACPTSIRQPWALSAGNRVRDTIRIRVYDDPARIAALAQVALADWRVRRARATGERHFCGEASAALAGQLGERAALRVLDELGPATVVRNDARSSLTRTKREPMVDLSLYAVGWTDRITSDAPLPQYLAAVYGGAVVLQPRSSQADPWWQGREPAVLVDEIAPVYPEWEPDALYVTFGGA